MSWLSDLFKRWKAPATAEQAAPDAISGRTYSGLESEGVRYLDPASLVSLMREAQDGDIVRQSALFEFMEESDGDLAGLLGQRKGGVLSCEFSITPGDDSAQAERAAEFCRDVIADIPRFRDRLQDLLDAVPKGFSVLEVGWDTSEKSWAPKSLTFKPQRWWTLDKTNHERLLLRDATNWQQGIEVNPLNFITHIHHALSGSLSRAGICLSCCRPFLVRNYVVKDWLTAIELFGQPFRLGKLSPGANKSEETALWNALRSLGTDAYGMIPNGASIEFPRADVKMSADVYAQLAEVSLHAMQMAVLGQTLTSGGEGGGSYALGQVHERVRFDLVSSDAMRLDETLCAFYAVICALNFGADVAPPRHVTELREPADLNTDSAILLNLQKAGVKIPRAWAHKHFQIPEPDDGDEVLEPVPDAQPAMGGFAANAVDVSDMSGAKKKSPGSLGAEQLRALSRSAGFLR